MRCYVIIVVTYWPILTLWHSFRREGNWNFQNKVTWILDKSKTWIPSHFWSSLHKFLPFCGTHFCEATFSKLTIIKSKKWSFLKYVENVLRPALSTNGWFVKKSSTASIPVVVLDNFCKLNCFFLVFVRFTVSITGFFYYFIVTFRDCVHLYVFAIEKMALETCNETFTRNISTLD